MKRFEALARHPLAIAGAVITTASAAVFIALVIAVFAGMFENPYAGLVIFLAIPAVFVVGLLMMPAGMWLEKRRLRRDPTAPADWPVVDFRHPVVRRRVLLLVALTGVNIVIILLAGYGGLHAMESPQFCGQACHTPMHPQFTAWGNGAACAGGLRQLPHRRRSQGVRARQARRCPAAGARRHRLISEAGSARCAHASWRAGADMPRLSSAATHDRRSRPRVSRVCRRRDRTPKT